ncbi:uncharacterized protein LOC119070871 [Bradysia coprophila]|uniref:uncharacterized protein LOC119070871 n=1 Tax=Bradysia coprophila TaxID=38358 RepID=UPI00187DBEBB|nr:uncharacterized protein LOC119070871 [Bradysia coprophila]
MKILVIVLSAIVSLALAKSRAERSGEIQKNGTDHQNDDKTNMTHLSNTVNAITSHLVKIIESVGTSHMDDVLLSVYPLEDVILFIGAQSDKSFQEHLYFLFDKLLDVVYCMYERLDDAWHGVSYLIESKLSQISVFTLQIVDEIRTLSEQSEDNYYDAKFITVKESVVNLTTSLIGLTSLTTSIGQLITTRDRSVSVIVETITSLILIHQYAVAAVACLLSRVVTYSPNLIHATGMATLTNALVNFISDLRSVLRNKEKGSAMTQLFHGDLHSKFSIQLIESMYELMSTKMIDMIYTTTTSLLNIIQEHAPSEFHILPDLIEQLTVISFRCGQTEFGSLDRFITYAFDGLFDVLHHISYKLDKHIQSSASTGSFQEPSEPIDVAVANVRTEVKRFIHKYQQLSNSDTEDTDLTTSTSDLMQALLDPMRILVHNKLDNDYSIILASSLQFIGQYVVGLILTPLISLAKSLKTSNVTISDAHSNFSASLSLLFIKNQMIFDLSKTQNDSEVLERLYDSFDDLLQNLSQLKSGLELAREKRYSLGVNAFVQLAVEHKSEKTFSGS